MSLPQPVLEAIENVTKANASFNEAGIELEHKTAAADAANAELQLSQGEYDTAHNTLVNAVDTLIAEVEKLK